MGKIILWMSKKFYHHIEIVCVTCPSNLAMGLQKCAMKSSSGNRVFRNKPFAIVALWWLKNSWNWCALSFNISVWFGTFEGQIISEWNLVLKKFRDFFPQLPANLIDSHSRHSYINQQGVEKLSPTELPQIANWEGCSPICLPFGILLRPHEFWILFTSLWKRPQPLPIWGWEFLGYFSKVVATFNHVGGSVGP